MRGKVVQFPVDEGTLLTERVRGSFVACGTGPGHPSYEAAMALAGVGEAAIRCSDKIAARAAEPISPAVIRQAIRSSMLGERWRHLIIATVVGGTLAGVPAGVAGYYAGWWGGFAQSCAVRR